ncbi:MAG: bifunctional 2-polyprenyl-6-hydroxyphenol methylase/3-demethylubiquinol 3-O-methyltransferase UbiG [Candidatus Pacebacteria bacterium]|nr:bifunctional 2-polyprenyl-6-hydroxyphenol methylase/3-demethylubiquinol 3-O-methyltransferase UbiG [Candidatus Paceibacterota bacterium]
MNGGNLPELELGVDSLNRPAASPGDRVASTIDSDDSARFAAIAAKWWDEAGPFKPLHIMNPQRIASLRQRLVQHFDRDPDGDRPLQGLTLLDIGCGGGLVSEPMARLGARVTGIDAAEGTSEVASLHAATMGLQIDYRRAETSDLVANGERFDIVLALEIIEHVTAPDVFLDQCRALMRPDGILVVSTLNRSLTSYAKAIIGAEYILGWLPRGTHNWKQFVKPSELVAGLRRRNLETTETLGLSYNPLTQVWKESKDTSVNYLVFARLSRAATRSGFVV